MILLMVSLAACSNGNEESKDTSKNQSESSKQQKSNDNNKEKQSNQKQESDADKISQNNDENTSKQEDKQEAPYQSENATEVSRTLSKYQGDENEALQQLPDFRTALNNAQSEVNRINQTEYTYNDYAIRNENNQFEYLFSFENPSNKGTYSIVSVDQHEQVRIIDNAYQP